MPYKSKAQYNAYVRQWRANRAQTQTAKSANPPAQTATTPAAAHKTPDSNPLDALKAKMAAIMAGHPKPIEAASEFPPAYDPRVHRAGDKVRIRQGKGYIETTVQAVDASGEFVPDYY